MNAMPNRRHSCEPEDVVDRLGLAREILSGLIQTLIDQEVMSSGKINPVLFAAQRYVEDIDTYFHELVHEGVAS